MPGLYCRERGTHAQIPLEALYAGDGKAPLNFRKGEILTEIIIPAEAAQGISSYTKYANRESIDFPIVGAAFWGSTEKKAYRVAFTAVDKGPALEAIGSKPYWMVKT